MKKLRFIAALFVAFGSLIFATPAQADEPPVVVVVTTPGGDDSSYQIPLTTTVTFDGVQYSNVYATTNSVITFGNPDGTYWDFPRTPSISLYSMDWLVYPNNHSDEHLIISASDGGFQVDISARPIWLYGAAEPTNINIVAAINVDGTVAISYSITGPTYEGQTRTGVRLTNGQVVTLEDYGVIKVEEPPVLTPEPVVPTPEPTVTPEPTPTPTPTVEPTPPVEPTPTPMPEVTPSPEPTPTVEPAPQPTTAPPVVPEGATLLTEGTSIEVIAPLGQRILSVTAWYGDPNDGSRGIEVSSELTQLANGQTSVTIESSNMYGDPAGGTVKVLIFVVAYEPVPTPEPTPTPEVVTPPVVITEPIVTPEPSPSPLPQPSPEPTIEPTPTPTVDPTPTPIEEPTPTPTPEETVEPTPEPTVSPTEEPTPAPAPSKEPVVEPTPNEPKPIPVEQPPTTPEELAAVVDKLIEVAPSELTDAQVKQLVSAAEAVLATAAEGSPAYQQALEALAVAAQADDIQVPEELASIPGIGPAAVALVNAINVLGNLGADMSPAHRATAKKEVVAAVILTQITTAAVGAAASAASTSSRKIK